MNEIPQFGRVIECRDLPDGKLSKYTEKLMRKQARKFESWLREEDLESPIGEDGELIPGFKAIYGES